MRNTPKVYPTVRRCIYCGATDAPLGKEHIIPYGLGGDLILPRASCKTCGDITGPLEQTCLRTMLGPARIRLGIQTRNPEDRRKEVKLHFLHPDGRITYEMFPAENLPYALWAYELPPIGLFEDREPTTRTIGKVWLKNLQQDLSAFAARPDGAVPLLAQASQYKFLRMIAKIAHSYAVAEEGLHSFNPMLLDFILGRPTHHGPHWIGGVDPRPEFEGSPLHVLDSFRHTVDGADYLMARIYLFYGYGAPAYEVVVGECR